MKPFLFSFFACLILAATSTQAATNADATIIKAKKVAVEDDTITIVAVN